MFAAQRLTKRLEHKGYHPLSYVDILHRNGLEELQSRPAKIQIILWGTFYIILYILSYLTRSKSRVIVDIERFNSLDLFLTSNLEEAGYSVISRSNGNLFLYNRLVMCFFRHDIKALFAQSNKKAQGIPFLRKFFIRMGLELYITQDTHSVYGRALGSSMDCPVIEFQHGYLQDEEAKTAFPLLADISFQWCNQHARVLNDLTREFGLYTAYLYCGYFGNILSKVATVDRTLFILSEEFDLSKILDSLGEYSAVLKPIVFRLHPRSRHRKNELVNKGLLVDGIKNIDESLMMSGRVIGQPSSALMSAYNNDILCSQIVDISQRKLQSIPNIPEYPEWGSVSTNIVSNYKKIWRIVERKLQS